ncbi:thiamine pyrophosphate-binding protein [Pelagibius sp. Alg239-R121]|uniref:thiamine pyrophosphate-binding protein n=1 Tax=Pelagibius sp. Alg239-R121 TaxID=2993448 RepID=UPI0024A746A7|nr:thiamine pyrophosphate-binding protein [Pelagibius sp. Alg239-R121]
MRGADVLVQALATAGTTKIFSLSGNQIMPVYDACIDAGIEIIHTRHEAAAVFMAEAWAQVTGQIGVALVTAAPGFGNALGPLYSARASESPLLLLTGDAPVALDGKGGFQELAQVEITRPLTKASLRALSAERIGDDAARLIEIAKSGRPGPVHMALPFDVLETQVAAGTLRPDADAFRDQADLAVSDLTLIQTALEKAERPLILTGPCLNPSRAGDLLSRLADAAGAPVVPMESPRGLNDPALGDLRQVFEKADVIVSLGKPIDFMLSFGDEAIFKSCRSWLVVDAEQQALDRAEHNLESRLTSAFLANPRRIAESLTGQLKAADSRSSWRQEVTTLISARGFRLDETAESGAISSAVLCAAVQKEVEKSPHSIVICDGGEFGQWAQAITKGERRIINGPGGAIGGGLCYGIGAKKACPEAQVVALMGDGTVGFHFAEFETAVRENTPFVVIVGNDRRWNAEHQIQLRAYGEERLIGCGLSDARYDLAAAGLGAHGEYVRDLSELDDALTRAFRSGKPACVNVEIEGLAAPGGVSH